MTTTLERHVFSRGVWIAALCLGACGSAGSGAGSQAAAGVGVGGSTAVSGGNPSTPSPPAATGGSPAATGAAGVSSTAMAGRSAAPSGGTAAPAAGRGAPGAGSPAADGGSAASGSGGSSSPGAAGSAGGAGAAGVAAPVAGGCTRDSLKGLIDSYFSAMAAHDAGTLPKAANLKFTENAKVLQLGEGLWKTAGKPVFTRNVLDTETCGTVTEAVVAENSGQVIFGLRLKVDAEQKLSEAETFVVRTGGFAFKPQGIIDSAKDDWEGILTPDQRSTREELNAAANGYFDLFSKPDTKVPFGMPCYRIENGTLTTPGGDCGSGIPAGNLQMTERRFPVVDLEAGITVGWVLFGGNLLDFHMFKMKGGKVQFINAVVGPSARASGWK